MSEEPEAISPGTRNEFDGSTDGHVLQAGAVYGDVHFGKRRRSIPARWRWLWIGSGLSVLALVATIVLSTGTTKRDDTATAATELLGVTYTAGPPGEAALENVWATDEVLEPDQVTGAGDDVPRLWRSSRGVQVGQTEVGLVIEGILDEEVRIEEMTARIVGTEDAPSGTLVLPPGAGGPEPKYTMAFDLDESLPRARFPDGRGNQGTRFFDDNVFSVRPGETFSFVLCGTVTTPHVHRWVVDLRLVVDSRTTTMTLGANEPFVAAGPAPAYQRYYRPVSRRGALRLATPAEACPTGDCRANAAEWAKVY